MPPKWQIPPSLCKCVKHHAPKPVAHQTHHIQPLSWGGSNDPENQVVLCGTSHDNVHHALDLIVHLAYDNGRNGTITMAELSPILAKYNPYIGVLIERAVIMVARGGRPVPHVYTYTKPTP